MNHDDEIDALMKFKSNFRNTNYGSNNRHCSPRFPDLKGKLLSFLPGSHSTLASAFGRFSQVRMNSRSDWELLVFRERKVNGPRCKKKSHGTPRPSSLE